MIETTEVTGAIGDDERPGIPGPEDCARRPGPRGSMVRMGDGREWALADYIPTLAPCWDQLYDGNLLASQYQLPDVRVAASHLLRENYDLPPVAVATLILGADPAALVVAIEDAMFGPASTHRTWTEWALGSLYANGIDPAAIPPDRLPPRFLRKYTLRAVPPRLAF